jgi:hypothetical protein
VSNASGITPFETPDFCSYGKIIQWTLRFTHSPSNAVDDRKDERWHASHEWLLALQALSRAAPERARPRIFHGVFCRCRPK